MPGTRLDSPSFLQVSQRGARDAVAMLLRFFQLFLFSAHFIHSISLSILI